MTKERFAVIREGDRIRQAHYEYNRKCEKRENLIFDIKLFLIGVVIGLVIVLGTGCGRNVPAETATDETVTSTTTEMTEEQPVNPSNEASDAKTHEASPETSWYTPSKEHDITVNSVIRLDGKGLYNFNDTVAAGRCFANNVVVPVEADYGVIAKVVDNDTVTVTPYNNTTEYAEVKTVTASIGSGDFSSTANEPVYTLTGYASSDNGFGFITVEFSTGKSMTLGAFKQGENLWVCNVASTCSFAEQVVSSRLDLADAMAEFGVNIQNSQSKSPIYYPIVAGDGEASDVEPWFAKSREIADAGWSDMHKTMAFYNYVITNIAYDQYSINQGSTSRWFLSNNFDGSLYTSRTKVGICQDAAIILALMCREQGIPANAVFSGQHAWTVVYIADYDRWVQIDVTNDMKYYATSADVTAWTNAPVQGRETYSHMDIAMGYSKVAYIGVDNYEDMKTYNISLYK